MKLASINISDLVRKMDSKKAEDTKTVSGEKTKSFLKTLEGTKGKTKEVNFDNRNDENIKSSGNADTTSCDDVKSSDENTIEEDLNNVIKKKDLYELLDLLLVLNSGQINKQQILDCIKNADKKSLEGIFSQILSSDEIFKESILSSNSSDFEEKAINGLALSTSEADNGIKDLADKLSEAVINDSEFKALVVNKLNAEGEKFLSNEDALKQEISTKINNMIKQMGSSNSISEKLDETNSFNRTHGENNKSVEFNFIETAQQNNSELDMPTQIAKTDDKEEKLLKDLLGDGIKNEKDSISTRITNVITRFENLQTNKPVLIEGKAVVNRENFNLDFIKTIKYMDLNNVKELAVKVVPKDLGEIVIRLTMDNGIMKANITAANKEAFELLNSQLPFINNELVKQNVSIQSFSLSLYNGDNFLFSGNGGFGREQGENGRRNTKVESLQEENTVFEENGYEDNSLNILA